MNGKNLKQRQEELLAKVESAGLDESTAEVVGNYTSPDFIISHGKRRLTIDHTVLDERLKRVMMLHPDERGVGGTARAYYYDDPKDDLKALGMKDIALIESYRRRLLRLLTLREYDQTLD